MLLLLLLSFVLLVSREVVFEFCIIHIVIHTYILTIYVNLLSFRFQTQ